MSWEVRKCRDEVRIAISQTELVPAKEMKQKKRKKEKSQKKIPASGDSIHRRKVGTALNKRNTLSLRAVIQSVGQSQWTNGNKYTERAIIACKMEMFQRAYCVQATEAGKSSFPAC